MPPTSSPSSRPCVTNPWAAAVILVAAGALLLLLWPPSGNVLADGGGVTILQRDIPPFHVRMDGATDQPTVGQWHLTFFVSSLQTGKPVDDAHLTLTATLQDSATPTMAATPVQRTFESYQCQYRNDCQDVNATFNTPGQYNFLVKITSASGTASVPFTYRVQPSSLDLGRITGNGLIIIVVLAVAYTTRYRWVNWFRRLVGKPPIERKRAQRAEQSEKDEDSGSGVAKGGGSP